ncbi:MAG: ATP-binding cassette domain-containing protein [Chthoniobacterales bacterium]
MKLTFRDVLVQMGDFSLEIDLTIEHDSTALFGPSGSGKTTILELIAGLRRLDKGTISLDDQTLVSVENRILVPARHRAIGYVPQDLALFPHLSVRQNLDYGRKPDGISRISFDTLVDLLEIRRLLDESTSFLSGGEKQRIALGRALLASPRVLLLDEPLAGLDQSLKNKILPYLERIRETFQIPLIYVTHDPAEILTLCHQVVVLSAGRVVNHGNPDQLFEPALEPRYRLR